MTTQDPSIQATGVHRLLSTKEASAFIGMSEHWLKASRHKPELDGPPFLKIGRAVKYDPRDLEAWLAQRRFRGTYEYPLSDGGTNGTREGDDR